MALKMASENISQLLPWLKNHLPQSFKIHQELIDHLNGTSPDLEFFVDKWPEPEAVACRFDPASTQIKYKEFWNNIIVGLFSTTAGAMHSFLTRNKNIFSCRNNMMFCAVGDKMWPTVQSVFPNIDISPCFLLKATAQNVKPLPVPEGMAISSVTEEAVDLVDSTWKFTGPDTRVYIQDLVRLRPSVMLRTPDGRHVGHMLGQGTGIMGLLYVVPEFRRQGYARVIISHLANKFFSLGEEGAYVFIEDDNEASLSLHLSVGFRLVPDFKLAWMQLHPHTDKASAKCA